MAEPLADGEWHRMHPVTPLVKSWRVLVVFLVLVVHSAGGDTLSQIGDSGLGTGRFALIAFGVVVLVVLIGGGVSWVSWRRARFRIGAEALELNAGVFFRQHRVARLDRVQTVEVAQPFVARLAGLARLTLEVAGGSNSNVRLEYLTEAQAQSLRNHLLARAAGVRYEEGQEAPEAPEHAALEVPVPRLVVSILLSGPTIVLAVLVLGALGFSIAAGNLGPLLGAAPALLGAVAVVWGRFTGGFGFRIATSGDGLRLRFGLLEHRAQTVPPGRVQAVRLSQGLLWRFADWWTVEVNVAGSVKAGNEAQQREAGHRLLPVGTRSEAVGVLSLVLPDLGVQPPRNPWQVIELGLSGRDAADGYLVAPRRARWVDPIGWRRTGVLVTDEALLIRRGVLRRTLDVVPHARTQSLGVAQGPLQRRLGVATFQLHSTPGPVTPEVPHLDGAAARDLLQAQARRAEAARAAAGPERWMEV